MTNSPRLEPPSVDEVITPDLQRKAAAVHEAGHAVMTFCLGGMLNSEGVEIDERQYCGSRFLIDPSDLEARERVLVLNSLAGWPAEYLWHGRGKRVRSRDDLACSIYDARSAAEGEWSLYDVDDGSAFIEMLSRTPNASDQDLLNRYYGFSETCYRLLSERDVWQAVELVASALAARGKLLMPDAVQAIGGSTWPLTHAAGGILRRSGES